MSDNYNFESGIDLNDLSWFEKLCQVPPPRLSDISSEEDGEIIDVKVPTQISRQLQRTKEKEARDVIVKERHRMEEEEAGRVNYTIELEASMKNRAFKQRSVQQLPRFQMPRDMWMPKKPWFPHPSGSRPRMNLRAPSPEKYPKYDQRQIHIICSFRYMLRICSVLAVLHNKRFPKTIGVVASFKNEPS